jgi:hypothetical protein
MFWKLELPETGQNRPGYTPRFPGEIRAFPVYVPEESRAVELRGNDCTACLQAKAALGPIQVKLELAAHWSR